MDNKKDQKERQDFFDRSGATKMLLSIFSDPKHMYIDDDLLNQLLQFGISLLDEGNPNVQKTIFNYCTLYPKSEIMFKRFHTILQEQIAYLRDKNIDSKDSAEVFELIEVHSEEDHTIKSKIVENLLRFLQLFTEGHNLSLQNYLRHQTNSRNRYDIIE